MAGVAMVFHNGPDYGGDFHYCSRTRPVYLQPQIAMLLLLSLIEFRCYAQLVLNREG